MGKGKSRGPPQKNPPHAASKTNIRPAGLPKDDRSLTLTENPKAAGDRLIVIQMIDGSTSTSAHFAPEPHHTFGDLRIAAFNHIFEHIQRHWGDSTARSLADRLCLTFSAQVPTASADSYTHFIPEIPKDSEKLTSLDASAVLYAQIPVAPKDSRYPMHPFILGMPAILSTPLLDRVHGGAATHLAPQPSPSTTSQLAEGSGDAQTTTLAQQVQELMIAMNKMKKRLTDTEKGLTDTMKELTDTKKELTDTKKGLTDTNEKLTDTMKELADTNEKLEANTEQLADTKKELTGLKAQQQEMLDSQEAIHGWISIKHPEYLDAIRARHLLNCGQAKLAVDAGLTEDNTLSRSLLWRSALANVGKSLETRRAYAVALFNERHNLDHLTQKVISTPALLDIFVDENSPIRVAGNLAAHPPAFSKESVDSLKPAGVPSHLMDDFKQFCIAGQGLD